jgi:hypothetical protein
MLAEKEMFTVTDDQCYRGADCGDSDHYLVTKTEGRTPAHVTK